MIIEHKMCNLGKVFCCRYAHSVVVKDMGRTLCLCPTDCIMGINHCAKTYFRLIIIRRYVRSIRSKWK